MSSRSPTSGSDGRHRVVLRLAIPMQTVLEAREYFEADVEAFVSTLIVATAGPPSVEDTTVRRLEVIRVGVAGRGGTRTPLVEVELEVSGVGGGVLREALRPATLDLLGQLDDAACQAIGESFVGPASVEPLWTGLASGRTPPPPSPWPPARSESWSGSYDEPPPSGSRSAKRNGRLMLSPTIPRRLTRTELDAFEMPPEEAPPVELVRSASGVLAEATAEADAPGDSSPEIRQTVDELRYIRKSEQLSAAKAVWEVSQTLATKRQMSLDERLTSDHRQRQLVARSSSPEQIEAGWVGNTALRKRSPKPAYE